MEALINMICELKILHSFKKIVQKFHGDPTFRSKVISEKQCYAVMKYIVEVNNTLFTLQNEQLLKYNPYESESMRLESV